MVKGTGEADPLPHLAPTRQARPTDPKMRITPVVVMPQYPPEVNNLISKLRIQRKLAKLAHMRVPKLSRCLHNNKVKALIGPSIQRRRPFSEKALIFLKVMD